VSDILLYVLFVVELASFYAVVNVLNHALQAGRIGLLVHHELLALVVPTHFVLTLLLLADLFSLEVTLAFFAVGQLIVLVTQALWRSTGVYVAARVLTPTVAERHKVGTARAQAVAGVFALVVYPGAITIAYFTHERPSEDLTVLVIAITSLFALTSALVEGYYGVLALADAMTKDRVRAALLIRQLMLAMPVALWAAITYWASGVAETRATTLASLWLLFFTILFLVAIAVIPYLYGAHRARNLRLSWLHAELGWLNSLIGILELPTLSSYSQRLSSFKEQLEAKLQGVVLDEPTTWEDDPRPEVRSRLQRLSIAAGELEKESVAHEDGSGDQPAGFARGGSLSASWVLIARDERKDRREEIAAVRARRPVIALVTLVVVPLFGLVLDQLGRWIWNEFAAF
jgi:hypothetical protein